MESPMRSSSPNMNSPKMQKNINNKIVSTPGKLPHHKVGRVKVGIRCRPAFKDEIEFAQGNFMSIIDSKSESNDQLGQISLTLMSGKQREFLYDYSFGSNATQDQVFDRIARPVVNDVLKGFNGTIFAYGQTGTGKTYTMGILEFVNNEHAGIIPRAISLLFDYVNNQENFSEITISLSFLQLYRETIQDLLAPINGTSVGDDNLAIREDPHRGFYVEGLQEFNVHTYSEAEALLNLGLENRAIAPTLMNATSSRSHTVLTLNIEQRNSNSPNSSSVNTNKYTRTVRSKLLMVDLAGSERVRRTVSKGTRLSEAKSINTSLSALGNVIAALAETNSTHVPYRDSKLTRLLQDSLGGTASTALIATVGPAAINYGETLSTLQFATRCMAVKTTPVQHEEIDYAEMCTRLQQKLNTIKGDMRSEMVEQQEKYEKIIADLRSQLEKVDNGNSSVDSSRVMGIALGPNSSSSFDSHGYESLMKSLSEESNNNCDNKSKHWLSEARESLKKKNKKGVNNNGSSDIISLVSYCYFVLKSLSESSCKVLDTNIESEQQQKIELANKFNILGEKESMRVIENNAMESEDFGLKKSSSSDSPNSNNMGSHLAPMTHLEALTRVEGTYRSNNDSLSGFGLRNNGSIETMTADVASSLTNYESVSDLAQAITTLYGSIHSNFLSFSTLMQRKDEHYLKLKLDLTAQLVERRKREEEVVNWSYILKYLLSTSSKLRNQLKVEKQRSTIISPIIKTQNFDNNDEAVLENVLSDNLKNMHKGINFIKDQELNSKNEPNSMRSYKTPFSSSNNPSYQKRIYEINQPNNYQSEFNQNNSSPQSNQMKLGSRLAMTKQAILHNQASHEDADLDIDQFGEKENEEIDEDDNEDDNVSRSLDERSIASVSEIAPSLSNLSFQSAATFNSIPLKVKKPPSMFAQEVVQGLGVEGTQAVQAMSVIDKVAKISTEQLRVMDVDTRTQILQIRKELGLDNSNIGLMESSEGERKKKMEVNKNLNLRDNFQHQQRQRSTSAPPRQRPVALETNLNKQNTQISSQNSPNIRQNNNNNNNRGPGGSGGRINQNNNHNNNNQINSIEKNSNISKEKERANYMAEAKRQQRNGNSLFIQSNNSEFRDDGSYNEDDNDNDVSNGYFKSPRPQKNINLNLKKNITPQLEKSNNNHQQNNNGNNRNSKSNYYNQNSSFQSYYEDDDGDDNFSQIDDLDFL
jgi:hypothetical protein